MNTHAIACAMTESCEWRGQNGSASALLEQLTAGSQDILHSWRFSIGPGWIGGFVDLSTDKRKTQMKHVACILGF